MATVQLRNPTEGRAYYDRKKTSGKTPNEAMRCLKRRLSDLVYRQMVNDAMKPAATGPGGHQGNVNSLQRYQLPSPYWLFGKVTSRTRQPSAYDPSPRAG